MLETQILPCRDHQIVGNAEGRDREYTRATKFKAGVEEASVELKLSIVWQYRMRMELA